MIKIKDYLLIEQKDKITIMLPDNLKKHLSENEQIAILATIIQMYERKVNL